MDSPLKWHGGKSYLAQRIVDLMPKHLHYVEPYFGGGSVLFEKDYEGTSEVVNDIKGELANFWQVLQTTWMFDKMHRILLMTPFSQVEYEAANPNNSGASLLDTRIEKAAKFFVRCRMSLAGRMKSFAPLSKNRVRRGMNEQASAWLSAIEGLPAVHDRLKRVVVLCDDALAVIRREDSNNTLFYLDPPYLPETRSSPDVYAHEMSVEDHKTLLRTIRQCHGKVMLSGYANDLYSHALIDWKLHTFDLPNNSAGGLQKQRKTECLWCNF